MPKPTAFSPVFSSSDVEIIKQHPLLSSYLRVDQLKLKFRLFEGGWSTIVTRERLRRQQAVSVLLYHIDSDQMVLIEQIRMGALDLLDSPWILEPVAGMVEPGDDAEKTAHKEAQEEAGCAITKLIFVHDCLMSPGISTEMTTLFCGLIDRLPAHHSTHGLTQEGENIRVHVMKSDRAADLLSSKKPMSVSCIILLQWLQLNRAKLRRHFF